MKSFKTLFVLAIALGLAVPSFAETQNVKVSGSIDMYGFYRNNFDLNKDGGSETAGAVTAGVANQDSSADEYFRTNTQVEIAADLTDNVSTVINVVNQRDWADASLPTGATLDDALSINLDLAYVKMKEIFYSPLTLTLGRQDIWLGRGFIIGNNNHAWDPDGILAADEYAVTTAFDAVRATLDFSPWTLDFIYSKISEGNGAAQTDLNIENDIDLYVVNVNYKFADYNAVAEGYFVSEWDRANAVDTTAGTGNQSTSDTETLGGRVQFDPISQMTLGGELAFQFGDYRGTVNTTNMTQDRAAWALNLFGTYRFETNWKPEVTMEWVHFSGSENIAFASGDSYDSWNSLYRGKFWTAYADFRSFVYGTDEAVDQPATTNQNIFQIKGSLKPMEDLLLEGAFSYLWVDEKVHTGARTLSPDAYTGSGELSEDIGWEVDLQATYDYTEDVTFGLLAGWFVPGNHFNSPSDETASNVVSSVKVSF